MAIAIRFALFDRRRHFIPFIPSWLVHSAARCCLQRMRTQLECVRLSVCIIVAWLIWIIQRFWGLQNEQNCTRTHSMDVAYRRSSAATFEFVNSIFFGDFIAGERESQQRSPLLIRVSFWSYTRATCNIPFTSFFYDKYGIICSVWFNLCEWYKFSLGIVWRRAPVSDIDGARGNTKQRHQLAALTGTSGERSRSERRSERPTQTNEADEGPTMRWQTVWHLAVTHLNRMRLSWRYGVENKRSEQVTKLIERAVAAVLVLERIQLPNNSIFVLLFHAGVCVCGTVFVCDSIIWDLTRWILNIEQSLPRTR